MICRQNSHLRFLTGRLYVSLILGYPLTGSHRKFFFEVGRRTKTFVKPWSISDLQHSPFAPRGTVGQSGRVCPGDESWSVGPRETPADCSYLLSLVKDSIAPNEFLECRLAFSISFLGCCCVQCWFLITVLMRSSSDDWTAIQCAVCFVGSRDVTREGARGSLAPWKNFCIPCKTVLNIVKKIRPHSENTSPHLGSQAGCGPG